MSNTFTGMLICIVDEGWNQLTSWKPVNPDDDTVEWDVTEKNSPGLASGYLVRHVATGMIGHSELDCPIRVEPDMSLHIMIRGGVR